jgi:methylated-DNA-protein-cysteine methyltransferase-like protein
MPEPELFIAFPGDEELNYMMEQGGFFKRVWSIVGHVPRGMVTTYGAIARVLGSPRAARTVGWAMRAAPSGSGLPCHRVVNASGALSPEDTFGGPGVQRSLLESEGVTFDARGRVEMRRHIWIPLQESDHEPSRRSVQRTRPYPRRGQ